MQFKCNPIGTKMKQNNKLTLSVGIGLYYLPFAVYLKIDLLRKVRMSKVISAVSSNHIWNLSIAGARLASLLSVGVG